MATSGGWGSIRRRAGARMLVARRLGLVAVLAGAATGCTSSPPDSASGPAARAEPRSDRDHEQESDDPDRLYGVGRQDLTLVDASRATQPDHNRGLNAQPHRTVPTIVLYPTDADPGLPAAADAPIAAGRFPLVVFSHGLNGSGDVYAPLVEPLVRAGYVVALPTFPLSSGRLAMQGDFVNQPGDVSFVIDELFRLSRHDDGWLAGHIDRRRVAAAGHSLGAVTTLGVVHNSCCSDDRIDAAVSVAGGPLTYPDGEYVWPDIPTLLIHGARDAVVPVAGSDAVFELASGPLWYLRFPEADHFGVGLGEDGALTMQATVAFLDAVLEDRPQSLDNLADVAAASGRAEWRVRAAGGS